MENKHKKTPSLGSSSTLYATEGIDVRNDKAGVSKTSGFISLYENSDNSGKNKINLKSPDSIETDYKITLPNTIATLEQVLSIASVSGDNIICGWSNPVGSGIYTYANASGMAGDSSREDGDMALVKNTKKLYVMVGGGWYFVKTVTAI